MAKGAGMIAPNVATMLAYVLTDANVQLSCLRRVLRESARETFNAVTVDGDMSTNDTVLLMANGLAGNSAVRPGSRDEKVFAGAVRRVMRDLSLKLVEDGEGSTKVVEIRVEMDRSVEAARRIAFVIANSKLVKTAFDGADPNFGRILAAIGYAGVPVRPEKIRVLINNVVVVARGAGVERGEKQAARATTTTLLINTRIWAGLPRRCGHQISHTNMSASTRRIGAEKTDGKPQRFKGLR